MRRGGAGLISRKCAGSNPVPATNPVSSKRQDTALLRQLSGFEALHRSHEAVAQLVRAPGRQPGGRRFKSGQSRSSTPR